MPRINPRAFDEDRLPGFSQQEVFELAEDTQVMREKNWPIPENSPHSFALARVLRIRGAFGEAAARRALEEFDYGNGNEELDKTA